MLEKTYKYFLRNRENKIRNLTLNPHSKIQLVIEPEVEPVATPNFVCMHHFLFPLKHNQKIIFPDDFVDFFEAPPFFVKFGA